MSNCLLTHTLRWRFTVYRTRKSKSDLMISWHQILFSYYYTSFIKVLSLTLFRALISNSIRLEWSMTEYLKFLGGRSRTFLAVSNFLPVQHACGKYLTQSDWHLCERLFQSLLLFPLYYKLCSLTDFFSYFYFNVSHSLFQSLDS